jgi:hypothetical protein
MGEAKIRLSVKEMEVANSTELILTKNAILRKVNDLLAVLQVEQQTSMRAQASVLPVEIIRSSPKISRGENYKGLPYLILDHPRVFEQEHIAAVRTMFLWGNFFSVTLHLSGRFKKAAEQKLSGSFLQLQQQGIFICINEGQWEHHFGTENYKSLKDCSSAEFEELVKNRSFIKLANKIPLQQWDDAPVMLLAFFEQLLSVMKNDQLPKR